MLVKMRYGFLFQGFKPEAYFWEIIIMLRKLMIIMASVFFSTLSSELQVLLVILIIIVSLSLHLKYKPYQTATLNLMETLSLAVSSTTLYTGLFYITGSHYHYLDGKHGLSWFFLICILLPNIIFVAYWIVKMRVEILKAMLEKRKKWIFKVLSCC